MAKLSVNVNKIATLRNARGENNPDLLVAVKNLESFGAQGITVHPRPDERHIRYRDVYELKQIIRTEYNIEGFPSESFVKLVQDVSPTQVTLVPDSPSQLTSNHGWNTIEYATFLRDIIPGFQRKGIRVSVFIDADPEMVRGAAEVGADRVELYTGPYAKAFATSPEDAIQPYLRAAHVVKECGLGLNAGHDLNLDNLQYFHKRIPWLDEVSIGHALICDALYMGLKDAVRSYLKELQ
ncbi:MAG: pyridoxine 5'-phosphate synthase [Alloprevotella sp.]|nr:pyridoxine 5'-phosphate synthase [Alloprevotella sp.]